LARRRLPCGARGPRTHRERRSEDRAAYDRQPVALAEHVLGAAEADALRAECAGCAEADALRAVDARLRRFFGLVRVRPDLEAPHLVGPAQQRVQRGLVLEARGHRRHFADERLAAAAVDAEPVALADLETGLDRARALPPRVDHQP